MSDFAVELINVTKKFDARHANRRTSSEVVNAICNIDLNVACGEFFTLLGPSGCGKTTTLRVVAGFEQPTSGEIRIQGQNMNDVPAHDRPVNTVFQSYALFPHLTVFDNVAFGLSVKRVPQKEIAQRVAEALELVRLPTMEQRRPSELSGGQQQRVALARALVNRPAVLLLDEPFGALDLQLRKEMQLELKNMQRRLGITFLFVTHDQEEALTMSDRIAVMHRGAILQIGTPVDIYERPTTRFSAEFIGEMNFLEAAVTSRRPRAALVTAGGVQFEIPEAIEGERVTLAFRPEAVMIANSSAGGADDIRFTGTLKDTIYIGTDRRYLVSLPTGEVIVSRRQNLIAKNDRIGINAGDQVSLLVGKADVRPLTH